MNIAVKTVHISISLTLSFISTLKGNADYSQPNAFDKHRGEADSLGADKKSREIRTKKEVDVSSSKVHSRDQEVVPHALGGVKKRRASLQKLAFSS